MSLRRRSSKLLVTIAAFVTLSASAFAGAAVAASSFTDVSPSSPFASDIDWMAKTGITTGYSDGTFRPGNAVTRQAMAAYLHRLVSGREVVQVNRDVTAAWWYRVTVDCPSGKVPMSGGGFASGSDMGIVDSYPSNSAGSIGGGTNSWTIGWETDSPAATPYSGTLVAFAICDWAA